MSALKQHIKKKGRVDVGWAARFESDRFFNPNEMICYLPNNIDTMGRSADLNSIQTKMEGCFSALDRVDIENQQRANNYNFSGLSSYGIVEGGIPCSDNQPLKSASMSNPAFQDTPMRFLRPQPDTEQYLQFEKTKEEQWVNLGQKMLHYFSLSGCL